MIVCRKGSMSVEKFQHVLAARVSVMARDVVTGVCVLVL
jgi:hypothetical protein